MSDEKSMSNFGHGVYFCRKDYASFIRRLLATLVDAICLFVVYVGLWELLLSMIWTSSGWAVGWNDQTATEVCFTTFCFCVWFYMAICKPSPLRTPGYWVTGLRIITLQGKRVPWYQMTYRLLIWVCGPLNFLFDAFWLFTDDARQSFRDCYAGTLVVRNRAEPEGEGPIRFERYSALGMHFFYKRAQRPEKTSASGDATLNVRT